MSLIYDRNNHGPSTDPCVTPDPTINSVDVKPFTPTSDVQLLSQSGIQALQVLLKCCWRS